MSEATARGSERQARRSWYQPLRSWRQGSYRRDLRFTREGRVFVLVTLGLGLAAVNTGNNLMYLVFAFMLSLIVMSGILSEHVLRGLVPSRILPASCRVGETAIVQVELDNRSERYSSYAVKVVDRGEGDPLPHGCFFLKLAPGERQASSYRRRPVRRGRLLLESVVLRTRFPFGLFEKGRPVRLRESLWVYPRTQPCVVPPHGSALAGQYPRKRVGQGNETAGLRDYRDGDELRSVHWRRSAALGRTIVREFELERGQCLSICIDNALDAEVSGWEDAFERQISMVAWLTEDCSRRGVAVELRAHGSRSPVLAPGVAPDAPLRFLAALQPVPRALAAGFGRTEHAAVELRASELRPLDGA